MSESEVDGGRVIEETMDLTTSEFKPEPIATCIDVLILNFVSYLHVIQSCHDHCTCLILSTVLKLRTL